MGSLTSRPETWDMVAPAFRMKYWELQERGIKGGTSKTYTTNMLNYWDTMRKLNIPNALSLQLPIDSALTNVYLIHSINFKKKHNAWSTMRGKLRAIDYFVQSAGLRQCWWKDAALFTAKQFIKTKHLNECSNTLAVTTDIVKKILNQTLKYKVYLNQLESTQLAMTESTSNDQTRAGWYIWGMTVPFMTTLGHKQSECWRNHDIRYDGYWIWLNDVTTFYVNKKTGRIREQKIGPDRQWEIHQLRVRLRHSKNRKTAQHMFLRISNLHAQTNWETKIKMETLEDLTKGRQGLHVWTDQGRWHTETQQSERENEETSSSSSRHFTGTT